jgi:uncharacterized protein YkwD
MIDIKQILGVTLLCLGACLGSCLGATVVQASSSLSHDVNNDTSMNGGATLSSDAILAEINRLRQDPVAYADWLETTRHYYDGTVLNWPGEPQIQTSEGLVALDDAIANLRQMSPQPPLSLSSGMSQAADDHIQDMQYHQRFSLRGSDGSTAEDRINRYGAYTGKIQELLSQGLNDPVAMVASLVIDDGNRSRSYRQTLLSGDFRYAGIQCLPDGRLTLCITNFATHYQEAEIVFAPYSPADTAVPIHSPAVTTLPPGGILPSTTTTPSILSGNGSGQLDPFRESLTPDNLSALSQAIIDETNLLRVDPVSYAAKLEALRPYYEGNLVKVPGQPILETVEGIAALDEAIRDLRSRQPLPTLSMSQGLNRSAADHAAELGLWGITGHYGQNGSVPLERAMRYGTVPPGNALGENISFGQPTLAQWHVIQLLIDDNVPNRGHREAMLRPHYRMTGSACAPHPLYRIVCVMTYASDYVE